MITKVKEVTLWFDVEEGYNTTDFLFTKVGEVLWFDVEEGYNTTSLVLQGSPYLLWFDVEEGYNTTKGNNKLLLVGCGLM